MADAPLDRDAVLALARRLSQVDQAWLCDRLRAEIDRRPTASLFQEQTMYGRLIANGVNGSDGSPLLALDPLAAFQAFHSTEESPERRRSYVRRAAAGHTTLGVVHGSAPDNLAEAGWGVLVNALEDVSLLKALRPLIQLRCEQQGITFPSLSAPDGTTCGAWVGSQTADPNRPLLTHPRLPIFTYRPGESCSHWLARHGISARPVDPKRGVPYYLLILGRPGPLSQDDRRYIPFDFQYDLDLFWGVGRLCFTTPGGDHKLASYRAYAEYVASFEHHRRRPTSRRIVYVATHHSLDRATAHSEADLVRPLFGGTAGRRPVAERFGFSQEALIGAAATRDSVRCLLGGDGTPTPALLFTATHGLGGFASTEASLFERQGALVCQDWSGEGPVGRDMSFAADDLAPDIDLNGLIAILFGCYSVGCPQRDTFMRSGEHVAPHAFVSALPQRLLEQGALAVLGHVDRAWVSSFQSPELGTGQQTQAFEDLLARLMSGQPVGLATDLFNTVQASVAIELLRFVQLRSGEAPAMTDDALVFAALWTAYHDLRSYLVLGDPAVRIPVPAKSAVLTLPARYTGDTSS
jgi:hypothetical protein